MKAALVIVGFFVAGGFIGWVFASAYERYFGRPWA